MDSKISRRDVLSRAALLGAGAVIGKIGLGTKTAEASSPSAKNWPWPYTKLDPAETAERAYEGWYRYGCGGTVVTSIFDQLSEKVGDPYKSFPTDIFSIFEGGVLGWGTLCGSLNGAVMVVSLIIGPTLVEDITHEMSSNVMDWYSHANMPLYVPKKPRANIDSIPHTVSESPLCHVSVGKWMKAANASLGSDERKDRCARVSASVAYKLVLKLNEWHEKGEDYFEDVAWSGPKQKGITSQFNCAKCHGENVPQPPLAKKIK